MMKIVGIVGWKDAGKTTFGEKLIGEFVKRGLSVSTIKHTHHSVDLDRPGKDTYRHREAGASEVILASTARWALLHEAGEDEEVDLDGLLARLAPVDIVVIEGFKSWPHSKIEVIRRAKGGDLLAKSDKTVKVVASDQVFDDLAAAQFNLNDIEQIAEFVLDTF